MNFTESEDDLTQKRRSSQWNPNEYIPGTDEDDEDNEIRKKIENLFDEEDDEEDPEESFSECAEIGGGSSESETPADCGNQQAGQGYQEAERGYSSAESEEPGERRGELIFEVLDDSIPVTEWKDKNIVRDAEENGVTVIKSKYLTAVPVNLIDRKAEQHKPDRYEPREMEEDGGKAFYDEDEDVYVPPEDAESARYVGFTRAGELKDVEIEENTIPDEDLDYNDVFQNDPEILRKRKKKRKVTGFIKNFIKEVVILILIFVFSVFLVASFNVLFRRQNEVFGSSMEPNYIQGDIVYSSYFEYIKGEPQIGDIVIFDYSAFNDGKDPTFVRMLADVLKNNKLTQFITKKEPSQDTYWIKRVVGVGGDTIEFRDGQFYRNGEPIYEEYIKSQVVTNYPSDGSTIVVPEGYVFLMGDNRNVSHDSRAIGCVPVQYIIGKCK